MSLFLWRSRNRHDSWKDPGMNRWNRAKSSEEGCLWVLGAWMEPLKDSAWLQWMFFWEFSICQVFPWHLKALSLYSPPLKFPLLSFSQWMRKGEPQRSCADFSLDTLWQLHLQSHFVIPPLPKKPNLTFGFQSTPLPRKTQSKGLHCTKLQRPRRTFPFCTISLPHLHTIPNENLHVYLVCPDDPCALMQV